MTRMRAAVVLSALALLAGPLLEARADGDGDGGGQGNPRRNRVVKVVEKAKGAVVSVKTPRQARVKQDWFPFLMPFRGQPMPEGALGSGVIFHPAGFVITNAHVIAVSGDILVEVPNGDGSAEYPAHPIAVDLPNDLAILQLLAADEEKPLPRFPFLPLGRSNDLMIGETVLAVGHPLRLGLTVTRGIISATHRRLKMKGYTFDDFIQVDAPINLGNSGGPLFDVTGRWIGVSTAIYSRGFSSTAEGIGFAIPIDRVRSLVAKAFKRRLVTGDWFGIELREGDDGEARVHMVYDKGPAKGANLKADDVVVEVNGTATPSLYDVRMKMISLAPSTAVRLRVKRGGVLVPGAVEIRGAPVRTRELALEHLGFEAEDADVGGVVITSVRPDSPAAEVRLSANDILLALGPFKINNSDDLLRFLQFVKPGDIVDVRVKRVRQMGGRVVARSLRGSLEAE